MGCIVWWGHVVKLQPAGPKRQAGGVHTRDADTWYLVVSPRRWASHALSCSHMALVLPSLGCLGHLPVCWEDSAHTWHLGWRMCEKYYYFIIINKMINKFERKLLYNILKGLTIPLTVYLELKHCGLKQCNGNLTLATKSCKGSGGGVGFSFH